jgi:hypothetical protein
MWRRPVVPISTRHGEGGATAHTSATAHSVATKIQWNWNQTSGKLSCRQPN